MARRAKSEIVVTGETGVTVETRPLVAGAKGGWAPESLVAAEVTALRDVRAAGTVEQWPVGRLVGHPDNPRVVQTRTAKFRELVDSIRANGIYEPITVRELCDGKEGWREAMGIPFGEILSGHRRFAAARELGLTHVPVRNLGRLADDLAYDIVAMGNLHEDLTPLEEGKRAATWLDKYNQDVEAVASKLGKTASWVVQHAQIARGLSAEWQQEIREAVDQGVREARPKWRQWTAGHLAVIARLPVSLQAHFLEKVHKDYRFFRWPELTVANIEDAVKMDLLYLSKAPFDEGSCHECVNRTDRQPLLWGETAEAATGDKARCLDKQCWDAKCRQATRQQFQEAERAAGRKYMEKHGNWMPKAVPLSVVEEPKDYGKREQYRHDQAALKRTFPKLLTLDRVKIVEEGATGAVPAIVVLGKGKNSVKWVKITEEAKASTQRGGGHSPPPAAAELAKREEERKAERRWRTVGEGFHKHLRTLSTPRADLLLLMVTMEWGDLAYLWGKEAERLEEAWLAAWRKHPDQPIQSLLEYCWKEILKTRNLYQEEDLVAAGEVFGFDARAAYDELKALEDKQAAVLGETRETPKKASQGKGKRKKNAGGGSCDGDPLTCGVGCSPCLAQKAEQGPVDEEESENLDG